MSGYQRPIKFLLGKVYVTPAAVEALIRNEEELMHLLKRHREGDYGAEMCYDDRVVTNRRLSAAVEFSPATPSRMAPSSGLTPQQAGKRL